MHFVTGFHDRGQRLIECSCCGHEWVGRFMRSDMARIAAAAAGEGPQRGVAAAAAAPLCGFPLGNHGNHGENNNGGLL